MSNNKENMSKLESFMKVLTGHFDNKEQYARMQKAGKLYPYAEHVNTVCNDKIKNLPADFQGKFLVEESYTRLRPELFPEEWSVREDRRSSARWTDPQAQVPHG